MIELDVILTQGSSKDYPMLLKMKQPGRKRPQSAWRIVPAIAAAALVCTAAASPRAWADDPNTVVATVGDHKISEKDLDAKVKPQLDQMRAMLEKRVDQLIADKSFDLRRQTLESMTDDYLIQQAARRDNLSVDDYLKKQYTGKSAVTELRPRSSTIRTRARALRRSARSNRR